MVENISENGTYDLWWLLNQTRDAIEKAQMDFLENYDLSPKDSKVLFLIKSLGDNVTVLKLAQYCFRQPHSMSEHLIRMEKAGLVKRMKTGKWKRIKIQITNKGQRAYEQLSTERQFLDDILSSLSKEQSEQFTKYLKILRDSALREIGPLHYDPTLPSQLGNKYPSKRQ